jgi:cytochrome c
MNNFEYNKIFAAILVAGIVASFSGFVARETIHPEEVANKSVAESGDSGGGGETQKEELPTPILAMISGASADQGKNIFKACAACHTPDKGGPNGVAPNLWNVMTRGKAAKGDYSYSDAMAKHKGETWTYEELNRFLFKPKAYVPGTKMTFVGLKKPEDRAAVIAYLHTLADDPPAAPTDADIAKEKKDLAPPADAAQTPADKTGAAPASPGKTPASAPPAQKK